MEKIIPVSDTKVINENGNEETRILPYQVVIGNEIVVCQSNENVEVDGVK